MAIDNNPTVCNVRNLDTWFGRINYAQAPLDIALYTTANNICATVTYGYIGDNLAGVEHQVRLNTATAGVNMANYIISSGFVVVDHFVDEASKKMPPYLAFKVVNQLLPFIPSVMGLHLARMQLAEAQSTREQYTECRYMYHDHEANIFGCNDKIPGKNGGSYRCYIPQNIFHINNTYITTNYDKPIVKKGYNSFGLENEYNFFINVVGAYVLNKEADVSYNHLKNVAVRLHQVLQRMNDAYISDNHQQLAADLCNNGIASSSITDRSKCAGKVGEWLKAKPILGAGISTANQTKMPYLSGFNVEISGVGVDRCEIAGRDVVGQLYTPFPCNQNKAAMNEDYGFPTDQIICPAYYYPFKSASVLVLRGAGCAEIPVLGVDGLLTKMFDAIYPNQYVVPYSLGGNILDMCHQSFA